MGLTLGSDPESPDKLTVHIYTSNKAQHPLYPPLQGIPEPWGSTSDSAPKGLETGFQLFTWRSFRAPLKADTGYLKRVLWFLGCSEAGFEFNLEAPWD